MLGFVSMVRGRPAGAFGNREMPGLLKPGDEVRLAMQLLHGDAGLE